MIDSVEFQNFKKHAALALDFDPGVTSIVGPNAGGKSSVLKGILFTLFGASAAGAKDHLWKWDADGTKSVGLSITLPDHGRVTITRSPTGAKIITPDGRTLASGGTAVTKLIEESMGMLAKDIRTLCYSPQGEAQGILTMGPTALQQKVEGLAQMETIDKVLGLLSTDITRLEGKLSIDNGADLDALRQEITQLEGLVAYNNQELATADSVDGVFKEQQAKLVAEYTAAKERNLLRSQLVAAYDKIITELRDNQLALQNNQDALGSLVVSDKSETDLIAAIAGYESQIAKLKSDILAETTRVMQYQRLQTEIANLEFRVERHEVAAKALPPLQEELAKLLEDSAIAQDKYTAANSKVTELEALLHGATCPTCKQKLVDIDTEAVAAELKVARELKYSTAIDMSALNQGKTNLERDIATRSSQLDPAAAEVLLDKQKSLEALGVAEFVDVGALGVSVRTCEEHLARAQGDLAQLQTETKRVTEIKARIQNLETLIADQVSRQSDLADQIKVTTSIPADHYPAEIESFQARITQNDNLRRQLIAQTSQAEATLAGRQRELELGIAVQAEQQKAQLEKADAEELQKYLKRNRSGLASDIWDGLLNYASALVSNTTGGVLGSLSRANNGEFTVQEQGRTIPVSEASGAQRSIIGLALRVAMTKVFYGNKMFLLLDEVTSDASDETAAAIAGMLQSLDMQIVSVTHRTGDAVNAGMVLEIGND